jgi:segregation and condensation protein B
MEHLKPIIEALIFASPEPVTPKTLCKLLEGETKEDVEAALAAVRGEYEARGGLQMVEVAGGYQIVTRPELHEWVRKLFHDRTTQKLSVQSLETLAVIAYKQPITAPEIMEIRGVQGAFKATTKAVQLFQRYRHKGKLNIRINTVVSRTNYQTLESLPELAYELGADGINLIPVDDHCGEILSMRKKDIHRFNEEIGPRIAERALALGLIVSDEEAFPFGRTESEVRLGRAGRYAFGYYDKRPCYAPWTHSLIDFNGNVYVCCMTRERIPPIGNIKSQSFQEIWEGQAYQRIRLKMHPPALNACRRCDDFIGENKKIWTLILAWEHLTLKIKE